MHKLPTLSTAEFKDYYETRHVPLVESRQGTSTAPLLYRRLYLPPSPVDVLVGQRPTFDVVTELQFVDHAAFIDWSTAVNADGGDAIIEADIAQFVDGARTTMCTATSSDRA